MFPQLVSTLLLILSIIGLSTCSPFQHPRLTLSIHNTFRAQHAAPPLTWNSTLAASARAHSARCIFEHSPPTSAFGENLAMGHVHPDDAVRAWVDERGAYDYEKGVGKGEVVGHFTQVVWRGSESVGCATVACDGLGGWPRGMKAWFLTCRYWPPGNYSGRRPHTANVMRRVGQGLGGNERAGEVDCISPVV